MHLFEKIEKLLELKDADFIIKDEAGNYQKPTTGLKGNFEIISSEKVDDEIVRQFFGKSKIGAKELRLLYKLLEITEKNVPNYTRKRVLNEYDGQATLAYVKKRKKPKEL